jgi:hypothetical protein
LQCELGIALGRTLGELSGITEREFGIWRAYRLKHPLPSRKTELYLAQIAMKISQSMGTENASLRDYLLFEPPDDATDDVDIEAMRQGMID